MRASELAGLLVFALLFAAGVVVGLWVGVLA